LLTRAAENLFPAIPEVFDWLTLYSRGLLHVQNNVAKYDIKYNPDFSPDGHPIFTSTYDHIAGV
jgi:hypothetical protein